MTKIISTFVIMYTLYFLSIKENRKELSEKFLSLDLFARVPIAIFSVLAFCIFIGNF